MSATAIGERGQTTLPAEVFDAAGLSPGDSVEWRFEDGEIRGRKLAPRAEPRLVITRLITKGSALVADTEGFTIDPNDIAKAVRDERESR